MLNIFDRIVVYNKNKTPSFTLNNGDYFLLPDNWIKLFKDENDVSILVEDIVE